MNTENFDVAIIGAGIVGASCAFHPAQRGLKVVVLEAFASHAEGSTGLSFGSIRGQWADDLTPNCRGEASAPSVTLRGTTESMSVMRPTAT